MEGSVDCKKLDLMVLNVVLFTEPVTEPFVLLNGPVAECLRLVHGKELPGPKGWNSRLPTWEPQVIPVQRTAVSHRLERMVPNLGTRGYHCKQLPVTRGWNSCFPTWEPYIGYHCKELPIPKGWN